ncbi:hypothetical protein BXZ70DRAFT_1012137 [Cristinia sonorae]|uniref:Rho-GAP domain-containing protein n=1 Tax=Cristinia sonorae TaxID=1940300 RepID=A0A8K0UH86_9AGAR|nr:hypothetical protein BXZ70DRAFT_1012137 [Cristinia sonorae]
MSYTPDSSTTSVDGADPSSLYRSPSGNGKAANPTSHDSHSCGLYQTLSVPDRRPGRRARSNSHVQSSTFGSAPTGRNRFPSMPIPPSAGVNQGLRRDAPSRPSPLSQTPLRVPHSRDLDNDSYRLAKACGQDALSVSASSPAGWGIVGTEDSPKQSRGRSSTINGKYTYASRTSPSPPAPPPRFPHPPVGSVVNALMKEVKSQGFRFQDLVDVDEFFEQVRDKRENPSRLRKREGKSSRVFGTSVTELNDRAMCVVTHSKHRFELPKVVVSCVDQLLRTGIYQLDLFRALPNRLQLERLVNQFNSPTQEVGHPNSTYAPSLDKDSMPEICALLHEYLCALPEPLLPSSLFDALWVWCVSPTYRPNADDACPSWLEFCHHPREVQGGRPRASNVRLDQETPRHRRSRSGEDTHRPSHHPLAPSQPEEDETPQLTIAHHLLLMLPPRSFALLNYLLAFFSQLPLSPANGIDYGDVSRLFATVLLGKPRQVRGMRCNGGGDQSVGRSRVAMVWLLNRWRLLSDKFDEMDVFGNSPSPGDERRQSLFASETDSEEDAGHTRSGPLPSAMRRPLTTTRHQRASSDGPRSPGTRRVSFTDPFNNVGDAFDMTWSEDPSVLRCQLDKATTQRDEARSIVREISLIVGNYGSR